MSSISYANVQSVSRPPKVGLARGLGTVLLWLLAGVLMLLVIPILLLFLITAVPLQYPTLFYAYIGAGQRTSVHEDDVLGYEFAL